MSCYPTSSLWKLITLFLLDFSLFCGVFSHQQDRLRRPFISTTLPLLTAALSPSMRIIILTMLLFEPSPLQHRWFFSVKVKTAFVFHIVIDPRLVDREVLVPEVLLGALSLRERLRDLREVVSQGIQRIVVFNYFLVGSFDSELVTSVPAFLGNSSGRPTLLQALLYIFLHLIWAILALSI
jgi:hypothetical protein